MKLGAKISVELTARSYAKIPSVSLDAIIRALETIGPVTVVVIRKEDSGDIVTSTLVVSPK